MTSVLAGFGGTCGPGVGDSGCRGQRAQRPEAASRRKWCVPLRRQAGWMLKDSKS